MDHTISILLPRFLDYWGLTIGGVSAYQWAGDGCSGQYPVDEYIFSVSPGNAYAWLHATNQLILPCFTVGVVRYVQGLNEGGGSWYDPGLVALTPWVGASILLSYSLTRQNSAFDPSLAAENGILFDLKVSNPNLKKPVLIDLYLNQGCQNLAYFTCFGKNTGYLGCDEQPKDVHVQRWRIHMDFSDNQWISASSYDLTSIIMTSVNRAYDFEQGNPDCTHGVDHFPPGTTSLIQLQVLAEAFNAKEGIRISQVSLTTNTLSCTASASPTSGTQAVAVQFTSSCSDRTPPYSYYWQFNDGYAGTSSLQNPTNTYYCLTAGTNVFYPTLTVTDANGAQSQPNVPSITVNAPRGCALHPSP